MSNIEDQRTDQFTPVNPEESELEQWLEEGSRKLAEKQFRDAIKLFEKVLRVDPDNMAAFEKLSLARSIQADMDHIAEYLAMGRELMSQHDWRGASEEFQAVLSIDPKNEEALASLKQTQSHLGVNDTERDALTITTGGEGVFDLDSMPTDREYHGYSNDDQETAILGAGVTSEFPDTQGSPDFQRKLEEALRIYEAGNLVRSRELLEQLRRDNPNHSQINFYLTAIDHKLETDSVRKDQSGAENMFKQGMDLLEQQKFDEARDAFQNVLRVRPDFSQAQLMLDRIDTMEGSTRADRTASRVDEAERSNRSMPRTSKSGKISGKQLPGKPVRGGGPNWAKIALICVPLIVIAAVVAYLMVIYPKARFDNLMNQARFKIDQKAYLEAISLLESALVVQPESMEALEMLGVAGMEGGKPEKAILAYQTALEITPGEKDLIMKLGNAQYENQQWQDAEKSYRQLIRDIRYKDDALFKIAMSLKNRNRLDDAIRSFLDALKSNEANSRAHFELAQCYEQKEMLPEAETSYQQAINTDPKFVQAYEKLGDFYRQHNEYEKSAEILKKLLIWFKPTTVEKSKKIAQLRFELGEMQYEAGDYQGAVESFTTVIQIEPNIDAFRNLGRAHYKAGKLTEAILVWRRGIELDNTDYDLWFQIGTAQLRMGDVTAAENSYKEALRIKPDFVKALTNLGFMYYQTYKYDLARQLWRQSLQIEPDQPTVKDKLKEIDKSK